MHWTCSIQITLNHFKDSVGSKLAFIPFKEKLALVFLTFGESKLKAWGAYRGLFSFAVLQIFPSSALIACWKALLNSSLATVMIVKYLENKISAKRFFLPCSKGPWFSLLSYCGFNAANASRAAVGGCRSPSWLLKFSLFLISEYLFCFVLISYKLAYEF